MSILMAKDLAAIIGGEVHQVDVEDWVVLIERPDGRFVAVSETTVEEFADRESIDSGRPYACISLA